MKTVQLPNSGTVITDSDGLHIFIPIQKQSGIAILCLIPLSLSGISTVAMLFATPDVLNDPSKSLLLFILSLIVFIAIDILLIGVCLWNFFGKMIVHVNIISMTIRCEISGFAREQKFDLEKIYNLRVRNLIDEEIYLLEDSTPATFFDNLISIDLTKLRQLRFKDLKTYQDPLEAYQFSDGFCSGILFDYNKKCYELGVNLINGAEAEQLVNIITQRYPILGSKKD